MKQTVLIFSRHADLVLKAEETLRAGGFHTIGVTRDQDALTNLRDKEVHLLLIGSGIELASRKSIRYFAETNKPGIAILEHNGGTFKLVDTVKNALKS